MNFGNIVQYIMDVLDTSKLTLGNVDFWVDKEGPWKGILSHDLPTSAWDRSAISKSVGTLASQHHEIHKYFLSLQGS